MIAEWKKLVGCAALAGALLAAGCGQAGPAAVQMAAGQTSAQSLFFGKLPQSRVLDDQERTLAFDGYRALVTSEVLKVAPKAVLVSASSNGLDESGVRSLKGSNTFFFQTGEVSGILAQVSGAKVTYSHSLWTSVKSLLIEGLQPLPDQVCDATDAIKAAQPTGKLHGAVVSVYLAQPRAYSRPIYQVHGQGLFAADLYVNALSGQLETDLRQGTPNIKTMCDTLTDGQDNQIVGNNANN